MWLGWGGADEAVEAGEGELETGRGARYGFDVEEVCWDWLVDGAVLTLVPFSYMFGFADVRVDLDKGTSCDGEITTGALRW